MVGFLIKRIINTIGYANGEPRSKGFGALVSYLVTIALLVFVMFSSIKFSIGDPFPLLYLIKS